MALSARRSGERGSRPGPRSPCQSCRRQARRRPLAVLLPPGFLNNTPLEADGRRILVKGRTYKELVPVESGDPDVEIEREVLRTSVVALDLRTGRFEVVQQVGPSDEAPEERAA